MKRSIRLLLPLQLLSLMAVSQATHTVTDPEKKYKQAKEFFIREQYAFAYPLLQELRKDHSRKDVSTVSYLEEDVDYYYIVSELALLQPIAEEDAAHYIHTVNNEPRRQMMSYHLAHFYFLRNEHEKAVEYFDIAGYDNISNEQIVLAKFEKAYALFNLKRFDEAKPLFNEIHQLPGNKYYIPATYYYGFISYHHKQYDEALKAFRIVQDHPDYEGVVPYYIAEIYYFQGKKDEALTYGQQILSSGRTIYYDKQLKLLLGQLYFERQDYGKALPLLEEYVNSTPKVSKEVLYELSYSYYKQNQPLKAIEGFKQLSNERDSMGQNSMYILGDLYLQTGQKANARNAFQYSAFNNSNPDQQRVSRFNYAKLSYELGYPGIALEELKNFIRDYPSSEYDAEAKELLVGLLANSNNYRDALALYESFDRPTAGMQRVLPRILYGRAIEYINDQQLTDADELLTRVINSSASGSILPYANFWKGEIAYRQGRYDDAVRHMNAFVQSGAVSQGEANAMDAKYVLGYSYLQKENYRQALTNFEQVAGTPASSMTPLQQDAYVRAADATYMLREYAKATSMYDRVITYGFAQADYATFQKGMIAGISNSNEKIRILGRISGDYPGSALVQDVNMEIAQTYIAGERFSEAIPFLDAVLRSNDNGSKPRALLRLGLANYNLNRNAEALKHYEQLINQYPRSSEADEALTIIRDIYVEEGRADDYIALMQKNGKAVSVSEADSLTYSAAYLKFNAGNCKDALPAFSSYIQRYATGIYVTEAMYYSAECYRASKDWQNAVNAYAAVSARGLSNFYEASTLEAARIYYFELKDYENARKYFSDVRQNAVNQQNQLEALRGLVRSLYQLKQYAEANTAASELLARKGLTTDDRSIGYLVLGKSQQQNNNCNDAIVSFRSLAGINKSAWGAEGRFEIANCYFTLGNYTQAEKAAAAVIRETGSYDLWVTKSYILLGDIFMQQKDYFNAKATYESVARNAAIPELRAEAETKVRRAVDAEKQNSKIAD